MEPDTRIDILVELSTAFIASEKTTPNGCRELAYVIYDMLDEDEHAIFRDRVNAQMAAELNSRAEAALAELSDKDGVAATAIRTITEMMQDALSEVK